MASNFTNLQRKVLLIAPAGRAHPGTAAHRDEPEKYREVTPRRSNQEEDLWPDLTGRGACRSPAERSDWFLKLDGLIFISANSMECSWPFHDPWRPLCDPWRPLGDPWSPSVTPGGTSVTSGGPSVTSGGPSVTSGDPSVTPGGPSVTSGDPFREPDRCSKEWRTLLWLLSPYRPMRLTRWQFLYQKAPL
ncbi:hypothetical protein EYF80_055047 [Liparis tanakae]|uniref:Uncharacterized protein n=1 Tax=Liparis tanakae TaxID=230148 RepID=A0A4Z2F1Z8_9TELE|nr:hypothetical protein EYF80_055047 [Liparis tanakae]